MPTLLTVQDLHIRFRHHHRVMEAVRGVSFDMQEGEKVAIVGESGSGKSVTGLSLGRLLPLFPTCELIGSIKFNGQDVLNFSPSELRKHRGRGVAYVFQEPSATLHPQLTIGDQIGEAIRLHQPEVKKRREVVVASLDEVGISDSANKVNCYPHELSGGMQQRVVIAMALACRPQLLVADEPTTALDVTIQAQILKLIDELQNRHGMAVLLITHNFGIVDGFADRLLVMNSGEIVERGKVEDVLQHPSHDYTRNLLSCIPKIDSPSPFVGGSFSKG